MAAFGEALASFRAWIALERGLSPKTLEAYGYVRRLFDDYYYPDGTMRPKEEYSNGMLWWLDSYYQK